MTKVVNSHILQLGALTDAAPGTLEIGDMGAWQFAADDPRIAVFAGQGRQHGAGLGPERHDPPASLRVGEFDAVVPDVFPAQELDLRQPAAGQQQQAEGGDRGGHLTLGLRENLSQALGLLGGKEPLALALPCSA